MLGNRNAENTAEFLTSRSLQSSERGPATQIRGISMVSINRMKEMLEQNVKRDFLEKGSREKRQPTIKSQNPSGLDRSVS